ncbi:MAG: hypothetical protein JO198_02840 [Candidatus Dormibacteraeota bacterium]|nr:hypothetical protein [Candidatus Dormibacteraeota bacterium]
MSQRHGWVRPGWIIAALAVVVVAGGTTAGVLLARPSPQSSLTFSGAISGHAVFNRFGTVCGELSDFPAQDIGALVTVSGRQFGVSVSRYEGAWLVAVGPPSEEMPGNFTWLGHSGVQSFDPERAVTVDATLAPYDPAAQSLRVVGSIACPSAGPNTTISFTGALRGPMDVKNVNCHLVAADMFTYRPFTGGRRIDVIGQAASINVEIAIEGPQGQTRGSVVVAMPQGAIPVYWIPTAGGVSSFDWSRGATFASTNSFRGRASSFTGTSLQVSGQVTCPN